jgi:hypothetical protein
MMKDKKAVQEADRKRYIEQRKADKLRRRGEPVLERTGEGTKDPNPVILVVCEGRNTEPSYFRQFKLSSATVKPVGKGMNTVSLVTEALALSAKGKYEQVWCVFGKDQFSAQDFNTATSLATASGFHVGYSNQAFEYWFILHFEDHQGGAMPRTDYDPKLNQYLKPFGVSYDGSGSKIVSAEFFDLMLATDEKLGKARIDLAITRAERIYNSKTNYASPATLESVTTVFQLVKVIKKHM